MKLKPVRGEIRTTNPMPNLGSSLVDAVKANAPQEQRVVNSLINLAKRAEDTRDKLETQRIRDKNTVEEEKLKERLLVSEDTINLGDRDGNLLSVEQIEASKKVMYDSVLKDYDPKNFNSPYYKDKTAFDSFESGMYNQMNLSRLRVNKKRDDSIKFTANKVYGEVKTNSYNELKNLPISNYWIGSDNIRDKFENKVNSRALVDGTVDVTKELFDYDKTSTINYLGKIYTMTDALGREVPDFAAMYIALTNTKEFEKLNLDLPGGKFEKLKNRKYVKNLGKDIPVDLRNAITEELKDSLTDQVYIENYEILKNNTKVMQDFQKDLSDSEKLLTLKDASKYYNKLVGYDKERHINTINQGIQDRLDGKRYTINERFVGNKIKYLFLTGKVKTNSQKFKLEGEDIAMSLDDRLISDQQTFISTPAFQTEIAKAKKAFENEDKTILNYIEESKQVKNLVADLGNDTYFNSEPLLNSIKSEVYNEIIKIKDNVEQQGKSFNIQDIGNPNSEHFLFTPNFIKTYKKDIKDVINLYKANKNYSIDRNNPVPEIPLNSNIYKKLQKTGIVTYGFITDKYLDSINIPKSERLSWVQGGIQNMRELENSEMFLKWKFQDFPKNTKTSVDFKLSTDLLAKDSTLLKYLEDNNIKIIDREK